jgi:hypothetical protein
MIWSAFGFVAAVLAYLWSVYLQIQREECEALELVKQKRIALGAAEREREALERDAQEAALRERALLVYPTPAMPPVPVLSPDAVAPLAPDSSEIEQTPLEDMPTVAKCAWQDYGRIIRIEGGYAVVSSCGKLYKISVDTCDSKIQVDPEVVVEIKFDKNGRWTCQLVRQRGSRDRGR